MRTFFPKYFQKLVIFLTLISIVFTQFPLSVCAGGEEDDEKKKVLIILSTSLSPDVLAPDDERSVIPKGKKEDLDRNHPLRSLPSELVDMILRKLTKAEAKNFYLAIGGWKETSIRNFALDFTLEDDFFFLVRSLPAYWQLKALRKWQATRKLPFASLEREQRCRGILARLSFFKPRSNFSYTWFHEQVLSQIQVTTPEQEDKKNLIALYADRIFKRDPAIIARPYDSVQDIRDVVAQLMQARGEAIPLICQLIAILREGKTDVTASWLETFTSKSPSVLRTLLNTLQTYGFAFGYLPWRAIKIIPEDFDPTLLTSVEKKIGISEDIILRAFSLSRKDVEERIELIRHLAARAVSVGIEPECISFLKERAFCVSKFEEIELRFLAIINNGGALLSPTMSDFLAESHRTYPHYTMVKIGEKLAGIICFLFERTSKEINSLGQACEMEWERRLLSRSLKTGSYVVLSFVPILIIVHDWISILAHSGLRCLGTFRTEVRLSVKAHSGLRCDFLLGTFRTEVRLSVKKLGS